MLNSSDIDVLKIRPTLKEVKCNSIYGNLFSLVEFSVVELTL